MPQCLNCKAFLPPGFVEDDRCIFCIRGTTSILYDDGNKRATKSELIKEYDVFLKMVREKNDILKKALKGDTSEIPEKLLME